MLKDVMKMGFSFRFLPQY